MEKITRIDYNWYFTPENGEEFFKAVVGEVQHYEKSKCVKIEEHFAQGEGDKWFYIIHYEDKTSVKIFNPNKVYSDNSPQF